jgi:hypothetical protein
VSKMNRGRRGLSPDFPGWMILTENRKLKTLL